MAQGGPPLNFASIASGKAQDQPLRSVQLDGHVVLKIIKHCRESYPTLVTGQLLGLDIGQTLEVTNCYAFPVQTASASFALSLVTMDET